jgi:outer membrane protein OmpA-like peptidoglycan-associated protein
MKRLLVFASLAGVLLLVKCASAPPPPPEIAQARLALEDARNAGAERTAPRQYDAATAHLNVAQTTWNEHKDAPAAAHWARLAEGEARSAQYRSEAQAAEEAVRQENDRLSRNQLAVRDAEIALLQARARTDAERRAAEAEARVAAERRQAAEELEKREAAARESERIRAEMGEKLAAEQARAEQESAQRTQAERDRINAELEKSRAELETTRRTAEEARKAAEETQKRLDDQRREDQTRLAELEKARTGQQESEEALRRTLEQLAQVREEERGLIVTLPGNIYFDVNKSDVKPSMRERLTEIGQALAKAPGRHILIEGHTDSDGAASYNLELSRLRAESVRSVLVGGGVEPGRVETHGYGVTRPVASNATAAGKAQNRRVEIVLQGGTAKPPQ